MNTITSVLDERIGNLTFVAKEAAVVEPVRSQITLLVRANYSNPPNHGARIVGTVLNDPALTEQWYLPFVFKFKHKLIFLLVLGKDTSKRWLSASSPCARAWGSASRNLEHPALGITSRIKLACSPSRDWTVSPPFRNAHAARILDTWSRRSPSGEAHLRVPHLLDERRPHQHVRPDYRQHRLRRRKHSRHRRQYSRC